MRGGKRAPPRPHPRTRALRTARSLCGPPRHGRTRRLQLRGERPPARRPRRTARPPDRRHAPPRKRHPDRRHARLPCLARPRFGRPFYRAVTTLALALTETPPAGAEGGFEFLPRWRRRELNPRPQSRKRWHLRA